MAVFTPQGRAHMHVCVCVRVCACARVRVCLCSLHLSHLEDAAFAAAAGGEGGAQRECEDPSQ